MKNITLTKKDCIIQCHDNKHNLNELNTRTYVRPHSSEEQWLPCICCTRAKSASISLVRRKDEPINKSIFLALYRCDSSTILWCNLVVYNDGPFRRNIHRTIVYMNKIHITKIQVWCHIFTIIWIGEKTLQMPLQHCVEYSSLTL
jgi:hypothetical protein